MDCKFYINDDGKTYNPRNRSITGTLSLSASKNVNNIKSIKYGIKSEVQLLPQQDSHGNVGNPIVFQYYYYKRGGLSLGRRRQRFVLPEVENIIITEGTIFNGGSVPSAKLIKSSDNDWVFPKNESVLQNVQIEFPPADEWFLPSSIGQYDKIGALDHFTFRIEYFVYVTVTRLGSIFKQEKTDEFLHPISYQAGKQFKGPLSLLQYEAAKKFSSKTAKPEFIDEETGTMVADDIQSSSRKPRFVRRFLNRKEGRTIPFTMDFQLQSELTMFDPLPDQFNLKFKFDFSRVDFSKDFGSEKRTNGLGFFKIESLQVKVVYTTALSFADGSKTFSHTESGQKILDYKFSGLVFDMKNCKYDKETQTGTLDIPKESFYQTDMKVPLIESLKYTILTSCYGFDIIKNFCTLDFLWVVSDTDNKLRFLFETMATLDAPAETISAPPYFEEEIENVPKYEDIGAK